MARLYSINQILGIIYVGSTTKFGYMLIVQIPKPKYEH